MGIRKIAFCDNCNPSNSILNRNDNTLARFSTFEQEYPKGWIHLDKIPESIDICPVCVEKMVSDSMTLSTKIGEQKERQG